MIRGVATALLFLTLPATLAAQDEQPKWDCDLELREEANWWDADGFSVDWTHWFPDRASIAIYAYRYSEGNRLQFEQNGAFSRDADSSFIVSPKIMRTRGRLWVQLAAGGRSLPPAEVSRRKGFYGIASFRTHSVKDFIGDAEELTITYFNRKQPVVDRYTVSWSTIEAGAERMSEVYRDYQERLANPEGKCIERGKEIIFAD